MASRYLRGRARICCGNRAQVPRTADRLQCTGTLSRFYRLEQGFAKGFPVLRPEREGRRCRQDRRRIAPKGTERTMSIPFNGLGMHLGNLSRLSKAKTRSISPE